MSVKRGKCGLSLKIAPRIADQAKLLSQGLALACMWKSGTRPRRYRGSHPVSLPSRYVSSQCCAESSTMRRSRV